MPYFVVQRSMLCSGRWAARLLLSFVPVGRVVGALRVLRGAFSDVVIRGRVWQERVESLVTPLLESAIAESVHQECLP